MNGFYEIKREENKSVVLIENDDYKGFSNHYHNNLEILLLKKGTGKAVINGIEYEVTEKTIVISDSYDAHAYKMAGAQKNEAVVLIVPYAYLSKFNKYKKGRKILNPIVKEEVFFDKFVRLLKEIDWNESNAWAVEAGVDFLLSQLVSYLELGALDKMQDHELFRSVLRLLHENFKEDCSLKTVARKLGYTPEHVSRVFHRFTKKSIPQYINELRFQEVERLLETRKEKIKDCVFDAGFQSLQSYYRYKSKIEK